METLSDSEFAKQSGKNVHIDTREMTIGQKRKEKALSQDDPF